METPKKRAKKKKRPYYSGLKPIVFIPDLKFKTTFCFIFDHNLFVRDILCKMEIRGISFRGAETECGVPHNVIHRFVRGHDISEANKMRLVKWLGNAASRYWHHTLNTEEYPIIPVKQETFEQFKLHKNFKKEKVKLVVRDGKRTKSPSPPKQEPH